jgi:hypothetical protein
LPPLLDPDDDVLPPLPDPDDDMLPPLDPDDDEPPGGTTISLAPEPWPQPTPRAPLQINDPATGNIAAGNNRPTRVQLVFDMD